MSPIHLLTSSLLVVSYILTVASAQSTAQIVNNNNPPVANLLLLNIPWQPASTYTSTEPAITEKPSATSTLTTTATLTDFVTYSYDASIIAANSTATAFALACPTSTNCAVANATVTQGPSTYDFKQTNTDGFTNIQCSSFSTTSDVQNGQILSPVGCATQTNGPSQPTPSSVYVASWGYYYVTVTAGGEKIGKPASPTSSSPPSPKASSSNMSKTSSTSSSASAINAPSSAAAPFAKGHTTSTGIIILAALVVGGAAMAL